MKIIRILLILLVSCISTSAQEALSVASTAYNNGNFDKAIATYNQIIKEKGSSPEILVNIGNAYFKQGDYGQAMLNYERCLRLDPSNKQAINNRNYIQAKIIDINKGNAGGKNLSFVADEPSFFTKIMNTLVYSHSSNMWSVWAAIMFILTIVFIALYLFRSVVLQRKIGFFGALTALPICIVFILFSIGSAKQMNNDNDGIITGFKVSLKSDPDVSSKNVSTPLSKGTKLDVMDTEESSDSQTKWYKVRLNSDIAGWIERKDFELI